MIYDIYLEHFNPVLFWTKNTPPLHRVFWSKIPPEPSQPPERQATNLARWAPVGWLEWTEVTPKNDGPLEHWNVSKRLQRYMAIFLGGISICWILGVVSSVKLDDLAMEYGTKLMDIHGFCPTFFSVCFLHMNMHVDNRTYIFPT